jgi:hypothetical protein
MQVIQARVLAQSQLVEFLVAMHKDLLQLRLVTLPHAMVKMAMQSPSDAMLGSMHPNKAWDLSQSVKMLAMDQVSLL